MELLNSEWFFKMVDAGGKTPADKLLAVFHVTKTWIAAPGIRETFTQPSHHAPQACTALKAFLTGIATAAQSGNPPMLASQLAILLQGAIAEELRDPGLNALEKAEQAAQAVIQASCRRHGRKNLAKWATASAAGLAAAVALAWQQVPDWHETPTMRTASVTSHAMRPVAYIPNGLAPTELEAVLTLQEQINRGACPAPQLLALPQGQVTAYMNAIHFRTPENPEADRANIRAFLAWFDRTRATECYYPPVNGHTLVAWR
jgi:hypothetical protein